MQFFVYSRDAIERVPAQDVPHVIVSVTSSEGDEANLPSSPHCRGVLRLVFPDLDVPLAGGPSGLFDIEHARAIWAFVELHRDDIERIVVHCDAGLSRSPAVAAAISKCLTGDDAEFFRRYHPNMRVYRILLDVWHEQHHPS
jgi:predicted protein tyrosine phosphatase